MKSALRIVSENNMDDAYEPSNVSCDRGQNHQVYKHGFHEETLAHRQSSMLTAPAVFELLKRKFETNHKQRRPMT